MRARDLARGQQASDQRRADAEHEEGHRGPGREGQLGPRAAEIAAAEIAAQQAQSGIGENEPHRKTGERARRADDRAFGQHLGDQPATVDAEHAQQGELRARRATESDCAE